MEFPIHIDTLSMELPIAHFRGLLDNDVFLSLKDVLILTNSADPDEMQQYAKIYNIQKPV